VFGGCSDTARRPAEAYDLSVLLRLALAIGGTTLCCLGVGLVVVDRDQQPAPPRPVAATPHSIALVRKELAERYVRTLDPMTLDAPTIPKLLARLDDRYTVYLKPHEYRAFLDRVSATQIGVGLSLGRDPHRGLRVVQSLVGSPAAAAGLAGGDAILAIDGVSTRGIDIEDALAHLQGGVTGTRVELRVRRSSTGDVRNVRLERIRISTHAVSWRDIGRGKARVRVIRIATFADGVARQVRGLATKAPAVILDLRGDPGGLLDEAVETTSIFVRQGRIVSWEGANVGYHVRVASHDALPPMPLAVLVDRRTASAAEIVAGAIRDHMRGAIVGTRTFGKGSLQSVEPLANGAALKLTIAEYRTPKGRDLHGRGVLPTIPATPKQSLSLALTAVHASELGH
jgi:carboxyl-terminal processing protease